MLNLFDCVIPTRSARFGRLYVDEGYINIKNERFRSDSSPISKSCDCYSCQNFSKSYISHLIHANELLGLELASLHNLRFYQRLMQNVRNAIRNKQFTAFANEFLSTHVYPDINDEKKVTD